MQHIQKYKQLIAVTAGCLLMAAPLYAASGPAAFEATLTLKNHIFNPDTLTVPVGTKIILTIINQDDSEEEFDSDDLGREVWLKPLSQAVVYINPLKPGIYNFQGEMNASTAKGTLYVH